MMLENIYYIGQTVAVVAILASLVAIYFQQRQRVRQANAEAVRDVFEKYQSYLGSLSTDPEYARMVRVSAFHWGKLSDNQKFRAHLFWWKLGSIVENLFQQHINNIGAVELYEGVESSITGMLYMPGVRAWWESAKFSYSAEFREVVDKRLADENNHRHPGRSSRSGSRTTKTCRSFFQAKKVKRRPNPNLIMRMNHHDRHTRMPRRHAGGLERDGCRADPRASRCGARPGRAVR